MNIQQAFEVLHKFYRFHVRAALAVGYSPTHYRQLRRSEKIPKRVEDMIIAKAKECLAVQK